MARVLAIVIVFAVAMVMAEIPPPNKTRPMEMPIDYGKVTVFGDSSFWVFGVSTYCKGCAVRYLAGVDPQIATDLPPIDCKHPFLFELKNRFSNETIQSLTLNCGDRSSYRMIFLHNAGNVSLQAIEDVGPITRWIPLVVAGSVLLGCFLAWQVAGALLVHIVKWVRRKAMDKDSNPRDTSPLIQASDSSISISSSVGLSSKSPKPSSSSASEDGTKTRIGSVDVFRGLTLCIMIFVNYGAGGYTFLNHQIWDGLNLADIVFPWFVFVMGVSMAFSYKFVGSNGSKDTGKKRWELFVKLTIRAIKLVCIGLFLNNGYYLGSWRIPGVPQRLGVSAFIVGTIALAVPKCCMPSSMDTHEAFYASTTQKIIYTLRDVVPYIGEYLVFGAFILVWTLVTFLVPFPGCPAGYLGPGGDADGGKFKECTGGIAGYIDRKVFGSHMYTNPTCHSLYNTVVPYDPEGLLGCLTSALLCFLGLQAGRILSQYTKTSERVLRWTIWGLIIGGIGAILGFVPAPNTPLIPINKNLWSLSFVLFLGGLGFLMTAILYLIVDVAKLWSGAPFKTVGMNSIAIYCLHEVLHGYFPFSFSCPQTHAWKLSENIIAVGCWCIVAYYMAFKKIFIIV